MWLMLRTSFDEILKACAESSVSIKADPYKTDSVHCPFYKRFGIPIFEYYEKNPEYAERFAKGMAGWQKRECLEFLSNVEADVHRILQL